MADTIATPNEGGETSGRKAAADVPGKPEKKVKSKAKTRPAHKPYMQNRELSWLEFNKRVLDQSTDPAVPLLERMKFIAIWRSNLEEFFMVRVGSLLDLELAKEVVYDSKTGMTPAEQLDAVYARVRELTPKASEDFRMVRHQLEAAGIHQLYPDELTPAQLEELDDYMEMNVLPLVSPQIINSLHPFPHLENGALYIAVRLDDQAEPEKAKARAKAAENVIMGIIPMPRDCNRIIPLKDPNGGYAFILLEHALEMAADHIFEMYPVKHANVIQVTRNADLDMHEESDEYDEDFRSHMQRILKKRGRLAPVRLESERPLSDTTERFLCKRLGLKRNQVYSVGMPLDMGYSWGLAGLIGSERAAALTDEPASPQWPDCLVRGVSVIDQVQHKDVMLSYPYESMDPFVHLLQEAAVDPDVISIKITLYRLASQSRLAEALITAAENGKEVTALFELRARFDESNNIEWSQRFEQAGCNIIYGFRDFKVHSKICAITRRGKDGLQFITQLGTGNYNEKTAKLYTDLSMITCDPKIGMDASKFFRNMQLETIADDYKRLWVAPLMIKQNICAAIDEEIAKAQAGKPCGIMMKTNSVTDKDVIEKLAEASRAGVKATLLVRGISCLVPGVPGHTDNIRVVSVVGRELEHSRIYMFGAEDDPERKIYLSSADLMTRNLDKRVEIAWPVSDPDLRAKVVNYYNTMLSDTAKLRELKPNGAYTELYHFVPRRPDGSFAAKPFDAQDHLIKEAYIAAERAPKAPSRDFIMHAVSTQIEALDEEARDDEAALDYERVPARRASAIDSEMESENAGYQGKNDDEAANTADYDGGMSDLDEPADSAAEKKEAPAAESKPAVSAPEVAPVKAETPAAPAAPEAPSEPAPEAKSEPKPTVSQRIEAAEAAKAEAAAPAEQAPAPAAEPAPAPAEEPKKKGFLARLFGK